jgi:hypothetical protein
MMRGRVGASSHCFPKAAETPPNDVFHAVLVGKWIAKLAKFTKGADASAPRSHQLSRRQVATAGWGNQGF